MVSILEGSAKRFSLVTCRSALCLTLNLLDEDHELEEFVAGIPGLSQSEALRTFNEHSPNDEGQLRLAALGPISFHEQLPWSIVMLSHRAITSGLSEVIRRRRTQACLKALYHIPGAIRDILAPYAAGKQYCLRILPLLNSKESLDLIEELRDTTNDDIALSVRCVTATISAFIITPPEDVFKFLPTGVRFIGGEKEPGLSFLSKRLHMGKNREDDDNVHHDDNALHDDNVHDGNAHHDDSARLQNSVLFLQDIRGNVESMDKDLWMRLGPGGSLLADVQAERRTLGLARHGAEYFSGIFKPHGNRTSLAFVLAVQHDLLALTLEILIRESVMGAAQVQRDAFRDAFSELDSFMETERSKGHIIEIAEMVVEALRPVAQQLGQLASTPQPEPDPPNELPLESSTATSSSTAQGVGVDPEQELRAENDEVTPNQLPLASPGADSSLSMEGVTTAADSTSSNASHRRYCNQVRRITGLCRGPNDK